VVCASMYRSGGIARFSDEVAPSLFDFVRQRIAEWQPHEAFVIDVCEAPGNEVKIVEINTLNCSGFYACDVPKLVMALEEAFG